MYNKQGFCFVGGGSVEIDVVGCKPPRAEKVSFGPGIEPVHVNINSCPSVSAAHALNHQATEAR